MSYKPNARVVSFSFSTRSADEILPLVEREAASNPDIIVLPETWQGDTLDTLDGGTCAKIREIAKQYRTYIIHSTFRLGANGERLNSAILIGRDGAIVGIYDKLYPYWAEFDLTQPSTPGKTAPVFDTDFGKVGIAICFDANFPRLWETLAEGGAEIVFWPSAYSAGSQLQAHALNHHYTIVTSTLHGDCAVVDITGKETFYNYSGGALQISRVDVNMNRIICHENYNDDKIRRLIAEHPGEAEQESHSYREQWYVLRGRTDAPIRELAASYGIEELRAYKKRSHDAIDAMRGEPFTHKGANNA